MNEPNYGAKQPNNTAYIKTFFNSNLDDLWWPSAYTFDNVKVNALVPSVQKNVYIPNNIYIGGNIIHVNDKNQISIKENIDNIPNYTYDTIMEITPIQYTIKNDPLNKIYYEYQNTNTIPDSLYQQYLETSPLIIAKIQDLQNQINILKQTIDEINN